LTVAISPAALAFAPHFVEPATARRIVIAEPRPHLVSCSFDRSAPVALALIIAVVVAVVVAHLLTVAVLPTFWHAPSSFLIYS